MFVRRSKYRAAMNDIAELREYNANLHASYAEAGKQIARQKKDLSEYEFRIAMANDLTSKTLVKANSIDALLSNASTVLREIRDSIKPNPVKCDAKAN